MLIIPAIDLKNGRCVRLVQGDMNRETVFSEDPVEQARKWESAGAKLIHIVDLDGAFEGMPKNREVIENICKTVNCSIQLGGGIRNMETADSYFASGVSRIIIGSLLLKDPKTARKIADKYPGEVIAGIDVRDSLVRGDGWTTSAKMGEKELVKKLDEWPLAAIVFTDISRDGMMKGTNLEAIRDMAEVSRFPLIASGGVSSRDDLQQLSQIPGVSGAIIGRALYTGAIDLASAIGEFQC